MAQGPLSTSTGTTTGGAAGFDALVLADGPHAGAVVAGLTLRERGRRVALKAGARRVLVLSGQPDAAVVQRWRQEAPAGVGLLVIRARDQVVHTPLVSPLVEAIAGGAARAVAVGPDGGYAG